MRIKTGHPRRFGPRRDNFAWRRVALALAACVLGTAVAAGSAGALVVPNTQDFEYIGSPQFFTVPAGVSRIHITAWGGGGGNGGGGNGLYSAPGGSGGYVSLDASVSPGDTLPIYVGGEGGSASGSSSFGFEQTAGAGGGASGTFAAGGPGGNINAPEDSSAGGGGGGGTVVTDGSTVLLAASGGGGGGGGGRYPGYNGGGGGNGASTSDSACDPFEGPGYFGNGLTGGAGGACSQPGTGVEGVSGSGETPGTGAGTGGGGGGGLIGGDGGADGGSAGGAGGGGGAGTSFWSSSTSNAVVSNGSPGNGGVIISWNSAPTGSTPESHAFHCCQTQQFTVPAGVTQVQIEGSGGSGGFGGGESLGLVAARGGYGAQIGLIVPVSPGDQLQIDPGGAGGNGLFFDTGGEGSRQSPVPGGAAGSSNGNQSGGSGGSNLMRNGNGAYVGGTGGGGGGGTEVIDQTAGNSVLLDAGGGGGAGGDSVASPGDNGGPGGNAGSPSSTADPATGDGFFGSGRADPPTANGEGGLFGAGNGTLGADAAPTDSGAGNGTGGGGGGGAIGSGAGQLCTTGGDVGCEGSGGGGAAADSTWSASATDINISNALEGPGAVTISWLPPPPTAPTAAITAPLPDKTYVLGAKVKTTFACAESANGPGLESCMDSTGHSGTSGLLNTSAPGIYTYTVTAKSVDGETATAQIKYAVTVKGYTAYEYCGLVIGCGNVLLVDGIAKLWQLPQLGESGIIQTVAGKPKKTDFTVTSEFDKGCVYTSVKTSTGYNSAASPGNWECGGVAIERWYAYKL